MTVYRKISANLADVQAFGPSFALRHLRRASSAGTVAVGVPGFGRIHVRPGDSDVGAIRQVFGRLDYDTSEPPALEGRLRARYEAILRTGRPIIVDAGANIGCTSLWFARRYPEARIAAVEPDPENARILRKNVASVPAVTVVEAAIGAEKGFVTLSGEGMGWAVRTARAETGLPIVTIEDAFDASAGDVPFLVKIDIEGFEKDLFSSNLSWIDRTYAIFIELHDWMLPGEFSSRNVMRAMADRDFEVFIRGENLFFVRA